VQRPGYVAPRTPIEQTLAEIWAEVLHVQRVGIHDNFFELGGDSGKAIIAILRIKNSVSTKPTLRTFFHNPTIGSLASLLKKTT
jgi:enterobactin synthetase component F